MEYGWRTVKDSLHPVYYEGNMSAEFLRDLVKHLLQGFKNGRFYMILILGKNISQYIQGYVLHKHRTFYIAISSCMNTLDHGEILLTCFVGAFCCIQEEVVFLFLTHI
jgi:hypothetical protein